MNAFCYKIKKCFSFVILLSMSFLITVPKCNAEEVITNITANYKLELVNGTIHPASALYGKFLEGKTLDEKEEASYTFSLGENILEHMVYNLNWEPSEDYICEKNDRYSKEYCDGNEHSKRTSKYTDTNAYNYFINNHTIEYNLTQNIESYVLDGEMCKSSARGCVAIKTEINNANIIGVYQPMSESQISTIRQSIVNEKNIHDDPVMLFNAMGDKAMYYDPYSDGKYSSIFYMIYTSELKEDGENRKETFVYNDTKTLDYFYEYRKLVKPGKYVCVATKESHPMLVNENNRNKKEAIIMEVNKDNAEEAEKECEKIFNTDLLGVQYEKLKSIHGYDDVHLWSYAVYKVENANSKKDSINISNTSNGMSCSWRYKPEDGTQETVKFSFGADLNSGKMRFTDIQHIENLSTSIYFTPNDMKLFLEKDKSILRRFEGSIKYSDSSFSWETVGAVVLTVLAVAANVAAAILTGGISLVLSAAATILGGAAIYNWGLVTINGAATWVGKQLGMYPIPNVYVGFPNAIEKGDLANNVKCVYEEFVEDFDMNSNYEVTCEGILDGEFGKILNYIMNIIRFVACGILILFGIIDFVKPIISGDAEMLQKSGTKFIKRIIVFVLILFAPVLVNLLLSLIDKTSCSI